MPLYWIRYDAKDEHELWRRLLPFNDHIGVVGQSEGTQLGDQVREVAAMAMPLTSKHMKVGTVWRSLREPCMPTERTERRKRNGGEKVYRRNGVCSQRCSPSCWTIKDSGGRSLRISSR